jgi:hypothetical protein
MTNNYMPLKVPWWSDMMMYWLEDQVAIAFHSSLPPASDRQDIITSLKLGDLNQFLQTRGFKLTPFTQDDLPYLPDEQLPPDSPDVNSPIGKYLFASPNDLGTIVISFFHIDTDTHEVFHPVQGRGMNSMPGHAGHGDGESNAKQVVNMINSNLEQLRLHGHVPVVAAMANWLGGTTCFIHGCSFTPVPVADDVVGNSDGWHISVQDLSPQIRTCKGKDVTVFVLDTLPSDDEIERAAEEVEGRNWLLKDIVAQKKLGNISFKYQTLPKPLREDADDQLVTGRDIYKRNAGFLLPSHGLFVAGILHDVAQDAKIECIRILSDFGTGDIHTFIHALEKIHKCLVGSHSLAGEEAGDLHDQPVVINLSMVLMPPRDQLADWWFGDEGSSSMNDPGQIARDMELLRTPFRMAIQCMAAQGAVIVGATGNDSNTEDIPYRTVARYPALFPEVISVGAVDKAGNAVIYTDYPTELPYHNGIVTYGGGILMPEPATPPPFKAEPYPEITVKDINSRNIDSIHGIYASRTYPSLSAEDPRHVYDVSDTGHWACWSGTSFAAPIISGVAARLLECHAQNIQQLPIHLRSAQVQWMITTDQGQAAMLTGNDPLQPQEELGVSMLRVVQE